MALPELADLKRYVKKQTGDEDTLLTALLASATAAVRAFVRRPLIAEPRTFTLTRPHDSLYRTVTVLHLPIYPAQAPDSSGDGGVVITDTDGTELVEETDYTVDLRTGRIDGVSGGTSGMFPFSGWPYTVTATVGLSALDEYETDIEPVLFQAILDVAADLYQRRSPAATSETTGGGVSTSYTGGVPQRVADLLLPFRMVRAL